MISILSHAYHSLFRKNASLTNQTGFGTFVGVFVPSILMLFGVIIFLRLGWILGIAGLPTTLTIVSLGALIAILTSLSMAAIATNIEIGKGGVYYILSRSLGLQVGAALGLPLYFKQTLSISFSIVGFAESLHDLIPAWSITTIGIWTLVLFTIFAVTSLKGALKIQIAIFIALAASLVSFFAGGSFMPTHPDTYIPPVDKSYGFWAIFAIFFPAMTGIESSVSLSGDLRNPSKSLPLGTISALLVAYGIYLAIPLFLANYVSPERLITDPLVMQDIAKVPSLIILGIWAATLSSALGGLLAAPRTLQAISDDGIISAFFGKTYGKAKEPRMATLTTFFMALAGIYFGTINLIAPLLTMICLICYCVLNFSAGFETFVANPSWRPRFRVHWAISILGAALCLMTMLMIDSGAALISLCLVCIIYLVAKYRKLSDCWDNMYQALLIFLSRFAIYRLAYAEIGSKSWRPHFLVFTEKPEEHSNNLIRFSQAISQNKGFLTMASFVQSPKQSEEEKRKLEKSIAKKLHEQNIQALVQVNYAEKVVSGMHQMIENYGLGPLMPNTIVFGGISQGDTSADFARVIQSAYEKHCNVIIISDRHALQLSKKPLLGNIHVWWDNASEENSQLMLVLAYMLQRNPIWKKARIHLKGTVASELRRDEQLHHFQEIATTKRVQLESEVYVSSTLSEEFFDLVKRFSRDAGIVFVSLRKMQNSESYEDYSRYLQYMSVHSGELPPLALVLSSEHTPMQNILK